MNSDVIHPYVFVGVKKRQSEKEMSINERIKYANEIIDGVANFFNFESRDGFIKKSRKTEVVTARQIAAYLIKTKTHLPDRIIADLLKRERTVIIHSISVINGYIEVGDQKKIIDDIEKLKMIL